MWGVCERRRLLLCLYPVLPDKLSELLASEKLSMFSVSDRMSKPVLCSGEVSGNQ